MKVNFILQGNHQESLIWPKILLIFNHRQRKYITELTLVSSSHINDFILFPFSSFGWLNHKNENMWWLFYLFIVLVRIVCKKKEKKHRWVSDIETDYQNLRIINGHFTTISSHLFCRLHKYLSNANLWYLVQSQILVRFVTSIKIY